MKKANVVMRQGSARRGSCGHGDDDGDGGDRRNV